MMLKQSNIKKTPHGIIAFHARPNQITRRCLREPKAPRTNHLNTQTHAREHFHQPDTLTEPILQSPSWNILTKQVALYRHVRHDILVWYIGDGNAALIVRNTGR